MKTLTLDTRFCQNTTTIENEFIDHYMAEANGEYVKVYLLLLRHLNSPGTELSISRLADLLDNTEKDIVRALCYWDKAGLLSIRCDEAGELCQITLEEVPKKDTEPEPEAVTVSTSDPVPEPVTLRNEAIHKPEAVPEPPKSAVRSVDSKDREELKQILFVAEQYLGKTLTRSEVDTILYFYETLGFSTDLIEYLIEYCADNGHRSIHYIRQVALAWYKEKITTTDEARDRTSVHNKNCYSILKAFGISGRNPAVTELDYIRRWTEEYGFELDMVLEACNRTMASIHQPSFEYADTILKTWMKQEVRHLTDVQKADLSFQKNKEQNKQKAPAQKPVKPNRFNNFQSRNYDLDSLEQQLLKSR